MATNPIQKKKPSLKNIGIVALIPVFIASFLGCIDLTIVSTAIPSIKKVFLSNEDTLQWVVVGLMITLSSTMIIVGKLSDIYGAKKILIYGLAILTIGSLMSALSQNISILILGRIIQGLGIAILYTTPPAIINETCPSHRVGKIMGYYFSINGLGLALGPVIGGLLVYSVGWRSIFILNIPISLICMIAIFWMLDESKITKKKEEVDIIGTFLLICFLVSALTLLTNIHKWGLYSYQTLMTFLFSIVVLCVFYRSEKETSQPIVNFNIFHNKNFVRSCACNALLASIYSVNLFFLPQVLEQEKNVHYPFIGIIMLLGTIALSVASSFVNRIVLKYSVTTTLKIGFVFLALSSISFTYFSDLMDVYVFCIPIILFGVGWGFILSPSITLGITSQDTADSGNSMGIIGTIHNFGGSVGLSISVLLYAYSSMIYKRSFFAPFFLISVISLIGVGYCFRAKRRD